MNQTIQNQIASLPASEQLEIAAYIYHSLAETGDLLTPEQIGETKLRSQQVDADLNSLLSTDQMWAEVDRLRNEQNN